MLIRFGFLYSCFMVVAGSSLLAELPVETSRIEPLPAIAGKALTATEATPAPAEPATLEIQPTPARSLVIHQTAALEPVNSATFQQLQEKQAALEVLQTEISVLRKRLGVAEQYQVECLLGEVSLKKLRQLDPEIQSDQQHLSVVKLIEDAHNVRTLPTQQFRAVEQCLETTSTLKVLMKPSLVVTENESTTAKSGGQFPIPSPAGGVQQVAFREFGNFVTAKITPLEQGKLRVQLQSEQSVRDERHAVKINGQQIPGLTSKSFATTAEIQTGETILLGGKTRDDHDQPICLIMAVTVTPINKPAAVAERPQLQPVPAPPALP